MVPGFLHRVTGRLGRRNAIRHVTRGQPIQWFFSSAPQAACLASLESAPTPCKQHFRRGFTLVELLVVISIIAILIALLLPAVQSARETARRIQCSNNLKQLGIGLHHYHDANRFFPPGLQYPAEEKENIRKNPNFGPNWVILLLPFLERAPVFDFRLPIHSLAVSTHKFLGGPIPCGVVLHRGDHAMPGANVSYIDTADTTLLGSRDGFSVLVIWKKLQQLGREGLARWARTCMDTTAYALERFAAVDWPAHANPFANTIVIKSPGRTLERRWHLAHQDGLAHLVIMPRVTRGHIDQFIAELTEDRS